LTETSIGIETNVTSSTINLVIRGSCARHGVIRSRAGTLCHARSTNTGNGIV
jgi:hypothetical protein